MEAFLLILKFFSLLIQSFICYWYLNAEMLAGEASVYLFFLSVSTFFILFAGLLKLSPVVDPPPEGEEPKVISFNADRFWNEIFLFILPMSLSTAIASQIVGRDKLMMFPFGLITLILVFFSFKKKFS